MSMSKPLMLKGRVIGGGKEPLICLPLVARTEAGLLAELAVVMGKQPDLIEWRVDFFEGIADTAKVVALGLQLRSMANGVPIIFTRRSIREGGEAIAITETQVLALYCAVSAAGCADFYDYELSSDPAEFKAALTAVHQGGGQLIASYHNFQQTPPAAELLAKFAAMEAAGADVVKIAVMPQQIEDVLTLLSATLEANQRIKQPIISMSRGSLGALSRLFGYAFGSSVTFAAGEKASAPGQLPIEDIRVVQTVLQRVLAG